MPCPALGCSTDADCTELSRPPSVPGHSASAAVTSSLPLLILILPFPFPLPPTPLNPSGAGSPSDPLLHHLDFGATPASPPPPSLELVPPGPRRLAVTSVSDSNPPLPSVMAVENSSVVTGHLRRRSSVALRSSPLIAHMAYNENTGEIVLPPSPPLYSWREKEGSPPVLYADDEKKGRLPPYAWAAEPRRTLRRPWLTVLIVASGTFALFFILSWLSPEGSSINSTILARIPFKSGSACNPYTAFGSLSVDFSEADKNQFIPFDPNCRAPSFLAKLRADRDRTTSPTDFSWLQNKTVLLIGDSISREHVENFCTLLGQESEVVRKTHKYNPHPSPVRSATKAAHVVDKPARLSSRGFRVVRDASLPRICYIPKYDFLIASVFHFGLDQEDYWRGSRMPQYSAPGMFEHRLSDVVQPLIANMRADGRTTAPDLVEVTSGTWDLARWAEQDMDAQKETETGLAQDRITWYRFRAGQILEKVRRAFPQAKAMTWRTMHYPTDQVMEHDYFMDKISTRTANSTVSPPPPSFSHNRVYQLDQAVRSLVLPTTDADGEVLPAPHSDFRLNEWGKILKGQESHQKDRMHGDPLPGGYLWADIMLYELHHGIQSNEAQPMRSMDSRRH